MKRADRVKATMELPKALWRRVRQRALDENKKAWEIVVEALERYFAKKGDR
jgi:hypothetical protein